MHGAGAAAAWFTVKVWPAIVAVPLRDGPGFAAAATVALPAPVPLAPPEIVNHGAFDVAVHAHDAVVLTATAVLPPSAASDALPGLIANVHAAGGGAG